MNKVSEMMVCIMDHVGIVYAMKKGIIKGIGYALTLLCVALYAPSLMLHFSKTTSFATIKKHLDDHCLIKNSRKSSCYVHKARLDQKIKAGLPAWARAQITEDLRPYKPFTRADLDHSEQALDVYRFQLNHEKLHHNKPLVSDMGREVIKDVLSYLAKHGYIQDTDFLISTEDYFRPLESLKVPLFVFAKDQDHRFEKEGVLIPDWMNLSERAPLHNLIQKAIQQFPWDRKKSQLFWRGAASATVRDPLIAWSLADPNLIDAQFISDKVPFIEPAEHLRYKYLISIDGVRCSWTRLVWHLESNSLVFKHQSPQVQWFYKGIKPDEHYKAFSDKTSLFNGFLWAESHPIAVQSMIHKASDFVDHNLSLEDMYHYFIVLIREYNKKLKE